MRVLGIDPGLTRCGVGVIEGDPGRPPRLLLADVVRTPSDADIGQRLADLSQQAPHVFADLSKNLWTVETEALLRERQTLSPPQNPPEHDESNHCLP